MSVDEFLVEYIDYALDEMEKVDDLILTLEKENDVSASLERIKRIIHSLKGSGGSYGLTLASTICHTLEDYLTVTSPEKNKQEFVLQLFSYSDLLKKYFKNATSGDDEELNELKQHLINLNISTNDVQSDYKCLIVDPSKTMRKGYKNCLKSLGVNLSYVDNGLEALERLLDEEFDAIIATRQSGKLGGEDLMVCLLNLPSIKQQLKKILIISEGSSIPTHLPPDKVLVLKKESNFFKSIAQHFETEIQKGNQQDSKTLEEYQEKNNRPLKNIIFVDDDEMMHKIITLGLKTMPDLSLKGFLNPKEAINEIKNNSPDLLLLDVQMEGMTGEELFSQLKDEMGEKVPSVIFLTGKDTDDEIARLMSLGSKAVITKPVRPKALPKKIVDVWSNI